MQRGYTTVHERNTVYEWKINKIDFFIKKETTFTLYSSKFSSGANFEDEWRIKSIFTPHDKIEFYLCLTSNHHALKTIFSFFILNERKEKNFVKNYQYRLNKGEGFYLSLSKKDLSDNKDEYLPNNTLTVCVDLSIYDTPVTTSRKLELNISKRQMAHDYTELYNSKMSSDVIINVGDKEFQAHKIILMARSPVLAAMFSHEMIEKKQNKVSITDITPEIFEKVLEYIYTDEVIGLDEIADELLEAAEKYQLQSLKETCQESLSATLNLENAFKLMTLADLYNANHLLEFTTDFLIANMKCVINTQDFKQLEKSHSSLALKLFKKYSFPKNEDKNSIDDTTSK
ncbi:speckle-type POZ protein-like [Microplitis mediator]|uniref:speckle-type POZ protein-like n=1 Tax=Microplitis mediator TaxID=375433 RepID=UPI0025549883|nr:speckle-type POZ protein-like [Microplitis mediator]